MRHHGRVDDEALAFPHNHQSLAHQTVRSVLPVVQITNQNRIRVCFYAVTVNVTKVMHLRDYGLAMGCDASFVLLQTRGAVEAIRFNVWKKGTLLAQPPEVSVGLQSNFWANRHVFIC